MVVHAKADVAIPSSATFNRRCCLIFLQQYHDSLAIAILLYPLYLIYSVLFWEEKHLLLHSDTGGRGTQKDLSLSTAVVSEQDCNCASFFSLGWLDFIV